MVQIEQQNKQMKIDKSERILQMIWFVDFYSSVHQNSESYKREIIRKAYNFGVKQNARVTLANCDRLGLGGCMSGKVG